MNVFYSDDQVTLHHGDSLEVLLTLPDGSVNCVVTSPPYYGLRDYGVEGQYGLEPSPREYVERMRGLFAEVRRVLAIDGTLWLNLGDSYARGNTGQGNAGGKLQGGSRPSFRQDGAAVVPNKRSGSMPDKNLLGIPWRVAFALQDDGWILRNRIVWHKTNAMPESVKDRLAGRCEDLFLFVRSPRYWFDLDAIREPHAEVSVSRAAPHRADPGKSYRDGDPYAGVGPPQPLRLEQMNHAAGRNPGDVWSLPTVPFTDAHFAAMPPALARRCVLSGCRPGGVVLDPFSGSGTSGMVALRAGRRYVGVDLSKDYLELSLRTRLAQGALLVDECEGAP